MYGATIECLQQAAIEPGRWPHALEVLSRETGSAGAILIPIENRLPGLLSSPNMQDVLGGYFDGGWNQRDERYRGVPTMMRKGVATEDDFITPKAMARSAYYRDFLERYGLRWFASTTILDHKGEAFVVRAVVLGKWAHLRFAGARLLLILRSKQNRSILPC